MSTTSNIKNIHEIFSRKAIISEIPEESIINRVVPVSTEPAILLYGPTKAGKTRLATWEATTLATKLNRRVMLIFSEPNIEDEDIADVLAECAYHNVYCEIVRLDHLIGIQRLTNSLIRDVERAMRRAEDLTQFARVVVLDSLSGIANLVISGLSENIASSGSPTTLPYVYPTIIKVIDPLRRVLSKTYLNGYLILTAQETGLRGDSYVPGVPIKSKPKYSGAGQYYEDLEIYIGLPKDLPESLMTCEETKENKAEYRPLIVAYSRRNPDSVGTGLAFRFVRKTDALQTIEISKRRGRRRKDEQPEQVEQTPQQLTVRGKIEQVAEIGMLKIRFIPADMLPDESQAETYTFSPLIPVIGCGPKKI